MKLSIDIVSAFSALLLSGCSTKDGDATVRSEAMPQSVYTGLGGGSCKKEVDKNDPNDTTYLACPGVAGYSLILRRVDAGRQSIDILDAAQRVFPLRYQEFVTRYMSVLDGKAEWRVASRDGIQVPIALIVRVRAHEDNGNPEKVSRSYIAVAKITPNEACVTDRIAEGTKLEAEVRLAADSARKRQCVPTQPPITADESVIR